MAIEIEHEAGTSDLDIKIAEDNAKKDRLAAAFGVEREKLDDMINECKQFFEANKKQIISEGRVDGRKR